MVRASLKRAIRKRLATVTVWVILPLALWNGRAMGGCICADGHYEPLCRGVLSSGVQDHISAQTGCCGCPCCAIVATREGDAEHCTTAQGCCRQSNTYEANNHAGQSIGTQGCCRAVAQAPATPTILKSQRADSFGQSLTLIVAVLDSPSLFRTTSVTRHMAANTLPPPMDLVVTLRRLVI